LSVDPETVTRFWLQPEVADGVGVGVAVRADEDADAEGDAEGDAEAAGSADAVAPGAVEEACWDLPLKAPATAKLVTSAMISRSAPPTNSRRRRYTAALGLRTAVEPDPGALPCGDDSPCLPILLG
jgi:hypothetical protein